MRSIRITFFFILSMMLGVQAFALSGAIYTTNGDCSGVNLNRYLWKQDVFLNGGPNNDNSRGLDPGDYFVRVTTPDGSPLGSSDGAVVSVGDDGRFASCYQLSQILHRSSNPDLPGYDTSPNGEYKAWVSMTGDFIESQSKTDNFRVDNPHIAVSQTCTPDVFVNDSFTTTVTVTNTGSVALTNVVVKNSEGGDLTLPDSYLDTLLPGQSYSWTIPLSSSTAGGFTTYSTASGYDEYFNYTATSATSCTTHVWALKVTKSASTSYTRDWRWTLTKTANASGPITIAKGNAASVDFTVTSSVANVDSAWAVSGTVTVHNPAPIGATVTALSDVLSDSTAVSLNCGGSAPFSIDGNSDLTCTYSVGRSGPDNGTNTATATLKNNNGVLTDFSVSLSYVFGDPTTVLHANAHVADSGITIANSDNTGSTGWSVAGGLATADYTAPSGGSFTYSANVTNVSVSCDNTATATNNAQLFDGEHTLSASASSALSSGPCGNNCTLTIGYWKTHAGFTGRNADRVTGELPQWLGTVGGLKSVNVNTAPLAVTLLSMSGDASNGINKLYAQELGAKLSIFRGASPAAVASTIAAADSFLAANNATSWANLSKTQKNQVTTWASTFDQYNNGLIGPGHCD